MQNEIDGSFLKPRLDINCASALAESGCALALADIVCALALADIDRALALAVVVITLHR